MKAPLGNITICPDYKDWHKNWLTTGGDAGEEFKAWEPDNTCIYAGNNLNDACKALNNSTFGDEQ